jgi:hypothetical protein
MKKSTVYFSITKWRRKYPHKARSVGTQMLPNHPISRAEGEQENKRSELEKIEISLEFDFLEPS